MNEGLPEISLRQSKKAKCVQKKPVSNGIGFVGGTTHSSSSGPKLSQSSEGSLDISSTFSMLRNDSSPVTTAVYEAGGETTIVDGQTGTATVVEGAEVVRTVAVSYATPILHHVLLQGSPLIYSTVSSTSLRSSSSSSLSSGHTQESSNALPELIKKSESVSTLNLHPDIVPSSTSAIGDSINSTQKTFPILVLTSSSPSSRPPSSVGSSRYALANVSSTSASMHSEKGPEKALATVLSQASPAKLLAGQPGAKNDDELTSLSWLQDSSFILGTALSPIKSVSNSTDEKRITGLPITSPSRIEPGSLKHEDATPEKTCNGSHANGLKKDGFKRGSPTSSDTSDDPPDPLEPLDEPKLIINDTPSRTASPASKPQQSVPYDPLLHVKTKPPYSFSCLIFMAIEESQMKALPVKDIYLWILSHFPYYRSAPSGWKNSVRHNLSLNKCFRKVEKAPNLGKGSLWMVHPTYRPNLLQALSKIPLHPYSNVDKVYMIPNRAVVLNPRLNSSKVNENSPPGLISLREGELPSSSSSDCSHSDSAEESPYTIPLLRAPPSAKEVKGNPRIPESSNLIGNPDLFPLLAKRLEANLNKSKPKQSPNLSSLHPKNGNHSVNLQSFSNTLLKLTNGSHELLKGTQEHDQSCVKVEPFVKEETHLRESSSAIPYSHQEIVTSTALERKEVMMQECVPLKVESEDVDAAAAMLILKHGPNVLTWDKGLKREHSSISPAPYFSKRKQKHQELVDPDMMLISSCPSLDHEYVNPGHKTIDHNGDFSCNANNWHTPNGDPLHLRLHQNDEFSRDDGSNYISISRTPEGKAPSHEKAEALLNLASIATTLALEQTSSDISSDEENPFGSKEMASYPETPPGEDIRDVPSKKANKRKAFLPKKSQKKVKKSLDSSKGQSKEDSFKREKSHLKGIFSDKVSRMRNASLSKNINNNYVLDENYLKSREGPLKVKKLFKIGTKS